MTKAGVMRFYALGVATGVLLANLAEPFVPIAGFAALYILGDLLWSGLRALFPHPDREER